MTMRKNYDKEDNPLYKIMYYGLEFLGRYYSTYRGVVVDNEDPEKLGRVKVVCPQIGTDTTVGVWAFPKSMWGGKDYGINLLPQKYDMVMIEFDHGDVDYPMWSHGGWGEDERPEEFDNPNKYGFKTPNKNLLIIDDGTPEEQGYIKVISSTGKEYFLIQKELFELEASKIKLGKNGDEKAALGDTTKQKIQDIYDKVGELADMFLAHTHPGNGTPASNAAQVAPFKSALETLKAKLNEMLSNKVTIDK